MDNNLNSLNNLLFEQIERINDDSLSPQELDEAIAKANAINNIASTIVKNANTMISLYDRCGIKTKDNFLGIE